MLKLQQVGGRDFDPVGRETFEYLFDQDQPAGVAEWQRPEQDGVDDSKDRRVGSDPEGKSGQGEEREERLAGEESDGVAQVLKSGAHDTTDGQSNGHSEGIIFNQRVQRRVRLRDLLFARVRGGTVRRGRKDLSRNSGFATACFGGESPFHCEYHL